MLFTTLMMPKEKGSETVKYIKALKAPKGIKIRELYFTFGRYDGILIFEAPDDRANHEVSNGNRVCNRIYDGNS